ncbi:MAG: G8 domain-containing protein, partial [Bacteroidota bacterium]
MLIFTATTSIQAQTPAQVAGTATITATQSGNWSAPATWGGSLPATDDRVGIPAGITVTVDGEIATEFKSVRIDGTLEFATNVNTELRSEFIFSSPSGRLEVGTSADPIDVSATAKIVFAESGGTDTLMDKERFAPGAVLMGSTRMYGAAKTSWLALSTQPSAGATQFVLQTAPTGW